jgi:hypothetical protein
VSRLLFQGLINRSWKGEVTFLIPTRSRTCAGSPDPAPLATRHCAVVC